MVVLRANSAVVARYFSFGSSKSEKSENFEAGLSPSLISSFNGWFATRVYVRDVACRNVLLVLQVLCVFVSWGIESFPCQCSAPYTRLCILLVFGLRYRLRGRKGRRVRADTVSEALGYVAEGITDLGEPDPSVGGISAGFYGAGVRLVYLVSQ